MRVETKKVINMKKYRIPTVDAEKYSELRSRMNLIYRIYHANKDQLTTEEVALVEMDKQYSWTDVAVPELLPIGFIEGLIEHEINIFYNDIKRV